jgi:NAD(P)-dependent dehydrogenase (short-subunit alcohol dehydrogenase family)
MVRRGFRVHIVARNAERLALARQELIEYGAPEVETSCVDLASPEARGAFLRRIAASGIAYRDIFVGGPGPRAGLEADCTSQDHLHAREVCLRYPEDVFAHAFSLMPAGGTITLLSSSAATEPLTGHRFHLSADYRTILELVVDYWSAELASDGIDLTVIRPRVVMTPLSLRYAYRSGAKSVSDASQLLASVFAVGSVPSSEEYLDSKITIPTL